MITYCHRCTVMKTEKVRVLEVFWGGNFKEQMVFFTKFIRGLNKVTSHNLNTYLLCASMVQSLIVFPYNSQIVFSYFNDVQFKF